MGNSQDRQLCLVGRKPVNIPDLKQIKYLALGIGSIRGIALIGAYEELKNMGLKDINGVSGSSIGSIIGLCIVLNMTISEMKKCMNSKMKFNFKITKTCHKYCFLDKEPLRREIEKILTNKGFDKTTTFAELYTRTNKDFRVVVHNSLNNISEILFYKNTPNMKITTAIMASASMPFVFSPESYKESCYVDGGLSMEIPFYEFPINQTLGLYLYDRYRNRKISKLFFGYMTEEVKDHIISIDISRVNAMEFDPSESAKKWLYNQGTLAVINHM